MSKYFISDIFRSSKNNSNLKKEKIKNNLSKNNQFYVHFTKSNKKQNKITSRFITKNIDKNIYKWSKYKSIKNEIMDEFNISESYMNEIITNISKDLTIISNIEYMVKPTYTMKIDIIKGILKTMNEISKSIENEIKKDQE